jgi:hypothetical protein
MVMIGDCIACQYGQHDGHHKIVQAVPDGVIGGIRCECKGDCAERNGERARRETVAILEALPLDAPAFDLLADMARAGGE